MFEWRKVAQKIITFLDGLHDVLPQMMWYEGWGCVMVGGLSSIIDNHQLTILIPIGIVLIVIALLAGLFLESG